MKKCVAFSLYARIMGERSTKHSLPALFFSKRRSAVVKEEFLFISAVFVVVVVVLLSGTSPGQCSTLLPL